MKSYLVREYSIWNMLFHGKPHSDVESSTVNIEEPLLHNTKLKEYPVEKIEYEPIQVLKQNKRSLLTTILHKLTIVACSFMILNYFLRATNFASLPSLNSLFATNEAQIPCYMQGIVDTGSPITEEAPTTPIVPVEVIAVTLPLATSEIPVYQTLLVNHTFGNSWGKPASGEFVIPEGIEFDKVVLTLNTSVLGVQYDRLANFFVGGVQVWRTSTAEPGNKSVFTTFDKDVTKYLSLFTNETSVLFQLDNLLTPKLTGSFDVQLYATLYNSTTAAPVAPVDPVKDLLDLHKPATSVISLTETSEKKPSLVYMPQNRISVNLPTYTQNTTRLTLSVFASGNAAEEFWYNDVLTQFSHVFDTHGKTLNGHGPIRNLNVYFNGEKIATQSPQPFIFTGGISPALWNPVVPVDAFDLPSIDIDLTALLPTLWESQSIADRILEIEVSNAFDELPTLYPQNGIAENWITSANVFAYESEFVDTAAGEFLGATSGSEVTAVAINPPFAGLLQQIINSKANALAVGVFNYTFIDGTSFNLSITSDTKSRVVNIQNYHAWGAKQSLVHVGLSKKATTVLDLTTPLVEFVSDDVEISKKKKKFPLAPNTIYQFNSSYAYPISSLITEIDTPVAPGVVDVEYNVKLDFGKQFTIAINGSKAFSEKTSQKGNSTYFVSDAGNHGSGDLKTKIKLTSFPPFAPVSLKREVDVVNNTIIADLPAPSAAAVAVADIEEPDYEMFVDMVSEAIGEVNGRSVASSAKQANLGSLYTILNNFEQEVSEQGEIKLYPPPVEKKFKKPCHMFARN